MGNSTRTLQDVVDGVSAIGDLNPVFKNTGGFANQPAVSIANATMSDLISQRFNWKWNRIKIPPFPLTSNQQDYASVAVTNLGWLENAVAVDINNTSFPQPTARVEVVRDLPYSSTAGGGPAQIAWEPNTLLEYGLWPGAGVGYTNPITLSTVPTNPPTNILDANGNILILSTYGITGNLPPVAPTPIMYGQTIADGTCVWTVANPAAAGFRVFPRPAAQGNVWLMRVFAQAKAKRFVQLSDSLDPIPDDYSQWFETGFIAYACRYSSVPQVKARYPQMKAEWLASMAEAIKQGNREPESYGFYPDRTVTGDNYGYWDNPLPGRRIY